MSLRDEATDFGCSGASIRRREVYYHVVSVRGVLGVRCRVSDPGPQSNSRQRQRSPEISVEELDAV